MYKATILLPNNNRKLLKLYIFNSKLEINTKTHRMHITNKIKKGDIPQEGMTNKLKCRERILTKRILDIYPIPSVLIHLFKITFQQIQIMNTGIITQTQILLNKMFIQEERIPINEAFRREPNLLFLNMIGGRYKIIKKQQMTIYAMNLE